MKIFLCFLFLGPLIGLLHGCNISSTSPNSEPVNVGFTKKTSIQDNSVNAKPEKSNVEIEDSVTVLSKYFGRWGGTGGGLIELAENEVQDVLENKKYSYTNLRIEKKANENMYLLKLDKEPSDSYIKRYVLLDFKNETHFLYSGYDSYEQYLNGSFSGAGEFFKDTKESH